MAIDTTIIEKPINFQNVENINEAYKVVHLHLKQYPNPAGSGAGLDVELQISIPNLPESYMVFVTPENRSLGWVHSKTTSGFFVVLSPLLASSTVTAGVFDCLVVYEI